MDKQTLAELAGRLEGELPDILDRINRLLGDEAFGDMVSEYEECTRSLRHWNQAPADHSERIEEYTSLIEELQQEILCYLQGHP